MPSPYHRTVTVATAVLIGYAAVAACGTPEELRPPDGVPVPSPGRTGTSTGSPSPPTPTAPLGVPTATATPTGFPDAPAVDCGGKPTGTQVIKALRRDGSVLPAGIRVSVESGPLCAGTWQYTVLTVPGWESLAVVTQGGPGSLRLVTAGTNVCSVPVRVGAPAGIRTAAACL